MSRVSTIFTNFIAGEVSSRNEGRVDLQQYYQSCRVLENFVISTQGGIDRDPGTKYICDGYSDIAWYKSKLVPFKTGDTQFVLEFSNNRMRVIKELAQVMSGGSPYEVNSDLDYTYVNNIHYQQVSETQLYLTVSNQRTKVVTYVGDTNWTIANVTFTGVTFDTAGNFPGAMCIFEQRLVLAGTDNNPNRIWFSKTGTFTNFVTASGSFSVDVFTPERMKIKWLVAAKDRIIFGSDMAIGTITGNGAAITSTNFQITLENVIGGTTVRGQLIGDSVLYPQIGNKLIREFAYSGGENSQWFTRDITALAGHLAPSDGFMDMALQVNPDIILWVAARSNGLVGLTYDRLAQIQGWHRHVFEGGSVESVCVTRPHSSLAEDIIYLCINRSTGRTIEYFNVRDFGTDQTNAYFVHCGKTTNLSNKNLAMCGATQSSTGCIITLVSTGTLANNDYIKISGVSGMVELNDKIFIIKDKSGDTFKLYDTDGTTVIDSSGFGTYTSGGYVTEVLKVFTGYSYLAGQEVAVLTDGAAHPDVTVSSTGTITLQVYANKIHAGYGYDSIIKPQRIEAGSDDGTAQGAMKRIHKLILRVHKSLGCKIGPDGDNLDTIIFRGVDDPMGSPPPLYSGDKEISFSGWYETGGDIMIVQDQPLPLTIVAVIVKLATYD